MSGKRTSSSNPDMDLVYELPLIFEEQKFGERILAKLSMEARHADLRELQMQIKKIRSANKRVRIGIIGKYFSTGEFNLADSYISVIEAVKHAAWSNGVVADFCWIDAQDLDKGSEKAVSDLNSVDGIVVPGGFGSSGVEGKIKAIKFARERNIPFLGLCFGFQLAVVEFARDVLGMTDAHSTEINEQTTHPVICLIPKQKEVLTDSNYGGTMRLGGQKVLIKAGSTAHKLYGKGTETVERFQAQVRGQPEVHRAF